MDLVVDANVLFAALIKKGFTSDLLVNERLHLYSTEYLFSEFKKYEKMIREKTSRSEEEFDEFMRIIEKKIKLIPEEEIALHHPEAQKISVDEGDTPYIALALKLDCDIWSNDNHFQQQDKITAHTTSDIMKLLKIPPPSKS